jgi:hypothetical protein
MAGATVRAEVHAGNRKNAQFSANVHESHGNGVR